MSNLRWAIHQLRRGLGATDAVQVEKGWISLSRCYRWESDLDRLADLIAVRHEMHPLEQVLASIRGEPFCEDRYEGWAQPIREQVTVQLRRAGLGLAQQYREAGMLEKAAVLLERVLEGDPLDEEVVRVLLEVDCDLGRHIEGLRAYERFARRLQQELEVTPGEQTITLARRLKSLDCRHSR